MAQPATGDRDENSNRSSHSKIEVTSALSDVQTPFLEDRQLNQQDSRSSIKKAQELPLRTYWLRALTCILAPISIAVFYAVIWAVWVKPYDTTSLVPHGRAGGQWVYYVWFVASTLAISISRYGLAGVEAAMLMDSRWSAKNAAQLMIHCDKTWAGPYGWCNLAMNFLSGRRQKPSAAWVLLASVSLLPYIALPLSGFTFQVSSGYVRMRYDESTIVPLTGNNEDTFGDQTNFMAMNTAFNRWRFPTDFQLPGRSAYYAPPENSSQVNYEWLREFPNDWPDMPNATVFLAPQAPGPVQGTAWGLQVSMSCTEIFELDEFLLLSQRTEDGSRPKCRPIRFTDFLNGDPAQADLDYTCQFDSYYSPPATRENFAMLYSLLLASGGMTYGTMELAVNYSHSSAQGATTFSDDAPVLIEAALWQSPIQPRKQCPEIEAQVRNDIGIPVAGMPKKLYTPPGPNYTFDGEPQELEAIGVQCNSSFITGTATLDGFRGTFESFVPKEPVQSVSATLIPLATAIPMILRSELSAALDFSETYNVDALHAVTHQTLRNQSVQTRGGNPVPEIASNVTWLTNLYKSVGMYRQTPLSCEQNGTYTSDWQQLQLLNSVQFYQAIVRAQKAYALALFSSSSSPSSESSIWDSELVPFEYSTILTAGQLSMIPVLVLLIIWSIVSSALGVVFGTRRRWAEILDGFSMFRFGSHFPEFAEGSTRTFYQSPALRTLPGLVGDSRQDESVGHITLVRSGEANRRKKYI